MSTGSSGVQEECGYQSHLLRMDISKELLEEDNPEVNEPEAGLTEVAITIEGKELKTLIDTGSEIPVISESGLEELKELNKNILSLPVAGVTIVGVTGVQSKRVTKQVKLNMLINRVEF